MRLLDLITEATETDAVDKWLRFIHSNNITDNAIKGYLLDFARKARMLPRSNMEQSIKLVATWYTNNKQKAVSDVLVRYLQKNSWAAQSGYRYDYSYRQGDDEFYPEDEDYEDPDDLYEFEFKVGFKSEANPGFWAAVSRAGTKNPVSDYVILFHAEGGEQNKLGEVLYYFQGAEQDADGYVEIEIDDRKRSTRIKRQTVKDDKEAYAFRNGYNHEEFVAFVEKCVAFATQKLSAGEREPKAFFKGGKKPEKKKEAKKSHYSKVIAEEGDFLVTETSNAQFLGGRKTVSYVVYYNPSADRELIDGEKIWKLLYFPENGDASISWYQDFRHNEEIKRKAIPFIARLVKAGKLPGLAIRDRKIVVANRAA